MHVIVLPVVTVDIMQPEAQTWSHLNCKSFTTIKTIKILNCSHKERNYKLILSFFVLLENR